MKIEKKLLTGYLLLGFREALNNFNPTALGIVLIMLGCAIFLVSLAKRMIEWFENY